MIRDNDEDERARGYEQCARRMHEAAVRWNRAHPFAELRFVTEEFVTGLMRHAGKTGDWREVAIAANLADCIDGWAGNEDTRAFLRYVDEESGKEGTFMMMRALVDMQHKAALERRAGRLPPGNWACVQCGIVIDAFQMLDPTEQDPTPTPGSYTVCAECGTLQRFSQDVTHFVASDTRDFNQLPKHLRKLLLKAKAAIDQRIADRNKDAPS